MNYKINILIFALISAAFNISSAEIDSGQNKPVEKLGVYQQLDSIIPFDLKFTDSEGKVRALKDIIDKPTILSLVYYRCPGICSPLLASLGETMTKMSLKPGKDYQALTISFNHTEDYPLAEGKKKNYFESMGNFPKDAWIWMVGDSLSVKKLTESVGFYFKKDGPEFIHSGVLIILSPTGRVTRYINMSGGYLTSKGETETGKTTRTPTGDSFLSSDLEMALIEANKEQSRPTVNKFLAWCFSYDPDSNKLVPDVKKIAGSIVFLSLGIFLAVLLIKGRKKKKIERSNDD